MIPLLLLLSVHFVADFVLQNDWMATDKSKSWKALLAHTATYSVCFFAFAPWMQWGAMFVFVTFVLHTITDAITSRITTRIWNSTHPEARHWFFVTIGADQLIHAWSLGLTYLWLG